MMQLPFWRFNVPGNLQLFMPHVIPAKLAYLSESFPGFPLYQIEPPLQREQQPFFSCG